MTSEQDINVIPEMVQKESVRAIGSSESFNITWDRIKNVNYGTVFYEVQLEYNAKANVSYREHSNNKFDIKVYSNL